MSGTRIGIALAAFTAAMWLAWLGWDNDYYIDSSGHPAGPYRAWQVIGCGATIVIATVAAWGAVRRTKQIAILPIWGVGGVAVPWGINGLLTDETGLWMVGLILLLGGGYVGLLVVTALASVVVRPRRTGQNAVPTRGSTG